MSADPITCPTCGSVYPASGLPGFPGMCPHCMLAGLSLDDTTSPSIPDMTGRQIGRYTLLEEIGEGGMGSVWRARQTDPVEREVALKLVKLGMDTRDLVSRFEAERQTLAGLDHPNIAKIFDAGSTETGRPYYVMELVDGLPITDYCEKNNLTIPDRIALFVHVCRAVQHAHQNGIIHRDLKPTNVLVADHVDPHLKVIDFGIAKASGTALAEHTLCTREGQILGTPGYMSPEQANGADDLDGRSDVYSLGALLYELLSGTPPFNVETLRDAGLLEVIRIIREDDPPKPSTRTNLPASRVTQPATGKIPSDLDWIALKALAKDPAKRYASPADLAADLDRHTRGQPVIASAPGLIHRTYKFLRRHRTASIAVTAALLVGLTTFIVTSIERTAAREGRLTVTSLGDSGPGSLRHVIADAPPRATIRFAGELAGKTIQLGGTHIEIDRSLSIDASTLPGGITIDAAGKSRHFLISEKPATVALTALKLTGGNSTAEPGDPKENAGGSIRSVAILKLHRCQLTGNKANQAGAIFSGEGGQVIAEDTTLTDNTATGAAGAIFSDWGGNLGLLRCTLARNQAHTAGAIYARTRCTIENTTLTGNTCVPHDQFSRPPSGGALNFYKGEIGIWNCTVTGNTAADVGGIVVGDECIVGIHNTVVADNHSKTANADLGWPAATIVHNYGGNFIGNNHGHAAFFPASDHRNQAGTPENPLDPQLAPLGDHGGPVPTMPPRVGSPVIDRGAPYARITSKDARGNHRTTDGDLDGTATPDAGAVEFSP